ncbi:hypothetical protein J3E64_002256 [Sphingobium sp. OAS761]|uniref:DUF4198 domain-containing protein n=1 Tax=Sphingobium sp. OAS761 TaxID=2817901 RepID=UPI0020A053EF|nr:DUF4198 domain-containing protein [Sphingobium sp. OAS761]MCP1470568.1 hypothetical protein [Sphingobium sp. OAS761]
MKARLTIAGAIAALLIPGAAQAHRQWMLPSSTILSGDDAWVTVDAAVSNDLFYFEHVPMRTDGISVTLPDGSSGKIENAATGKYRSVFDVHLTQPGTYRIASVSSGIMGSYMLNGKRERLPRGTTKDKLASAIPAGATDVRTAEMSNRNEIFLTLGAPTTTIFKPAGEGIEMVPVTHPNDLIAGETATFQFLLDGRPAEDIKVTIIPGGIRYRDSLNQMDMSTDKDGRLSVTWPEPGMYWMSASIGGGRAGGPGASGASGMGQDNAGSQDDGPAGPPPRRASYVSTLEVMAP